MKKTLFLLIISLMTVSFCYAADVETGTVADLYEQSYGRSIVYDKSELLTVWYVGSANAEIGLSGNTSNNTHFLTFYEDGQAITATRFGGGATIALYTYNSAEKVASLINSDTSGYWKASIGRDATPGTSLANLVYLPPIGALPASEKVAWENADNAVTPATTFLEDLSNSKILRCGFPANGRKTYRLKQFTESTNGVGAHTIKVWDGETCVYRRVYATSFDYSGSYAGGVSYYERVTPLTVTFGTKGLSAHKGKNLTVTSEWATTMAGDSETNENLSILVGEWTE